MVLARRPRGVIELQLTTVHATGYIRLCPTTVPRWLTVVQVVTTPHKTGLGTALYREALLWARAHGYRGLASVPGERTMAGERFWTRLRVRATTRRGRGIEYLTGWLHESLRHDHHRRHRHGQPPDVPEGGRVDARYQGSAR